MLEVWPDADKYVFKEKFIERYSKLTDWEAFKKFSLSFLRKSIRINTLKTDVGEVLSRLEKSWELEKVPWCEEGYFMKHKGGRKDLGNTKEHALGYYYVQEAASMIPPIVLGPKPGETILDMAAAPGSKTSQIAQYMKNEGILVANDVKGQRLAALGINLQRMGVYNTLVTLMQGQHFGKTTLQFDRVLLDAPCTGTGTIRKSPKTINIWNPKQIDRIAKLQRSLIRAAWHVLKPGGTMVYSTCSLEPEENEGAVTYLLEEFSNAKLMPIKLEIKRTPAVQEFEGKKYHKDIKHCLRLFPQDNDTEGFFVAKIVKEE